MRMWNVDPKLLCRQHLLTEHLEMHCFANGMNEGNEYHGFVRNGTVDLEHVDARHEALAQEMLTRGYKHKSPMVPHYQFKGGKVDVARNLQILSERCQGCRERQGV
jgi:hypothetical protein